MLGFTFRFVSVKPAIYKPIGPAVHSTRSTSPAPCQMPTTDRFLRSTLRLIFVHRKDRDVIFEELLPPLGFSAMTNLVPSVSTTGTLYFSRTQWLSWLLPAWVHPACNDQIRSENQCRGSGNHIFRNTSARSWFMWPGLIAKVRSPDSQSA